MKLIANSIISQFFSSQLNVDIGSFISTSFRRKYCMISDGAMKNRAF